MKTMKVFLGGTLLILGLSAVSVNALSQDNKPTREERKEIKKAQMSRNFFILDSLLNSRCFVLEADYLSNNMGNMISVTSTLNFIRVEFTKGVLQTGNNVGMGLNGVGGVTAEGDIRSWQLTGNVKKLTHMLHFTLLTEIGEYDIFLTVTADNNATATISGMGPGRLTWIGHLNMISNSRTFKGMNAI
ncbi:MAG: DUF4251 domain-containing protein [Bacteroidales bacterium]|jgi:hypothetical protein